MTKKMCAESAGRPESRIRRCTIPVLVVAVSSMCTRNAFCSGSTIAMRGSARYGGFCTFVERGRGLRRRTGLLFSKDLRWIEELVLCGVVLDVIFSSG